MFYPFIKKAVTKRFSDEAISVREAAVSLVGSYAVHSPAVANAFHSAFMVGLNDSGVSVRKRTVKILQDILCSNPSYKGRAAACSEMLRLAADPKEDDGVRDLIHDLFLKIWLENGDATVVQEIRSPVVSPSIDNQMKSPGAYVIGVEVAGVITPTPQRQSPCTPTPLKRETRSTEKKTSSKKLQVRSEIAAEQMVEVVKAADTGENLTTLFRELLSGVSDADKNRKASERRKRKGLAQGHCEMLVDALFEILLSVEENRSTLLPGKELVAIMRTIRVFTDVSPADVLRHLDTLLPYLKADNGLRFQDESVVVSSLSGALSRMTFIFEKEDIERLGNSSLAEDLVSITYKFGRESLSSAICAFCSLAHHQYADEESPFRTKLLKLAQTFYKYLLKHRDVENFASLKVWQSLVLYFLVFQPCLTTVISRHNIRTKPRPIFRER
jgi:cohesin loading factor subunit SCC2